MLQGACNIRPACYNSCIMNYRAKILALRSQYQKGEISHEKAKKEVEALLVIMNDKEKEVAKKYGKKYTPLKFGYVFR